MPDGSEFIINKTEFGKDSMFALNAAQRLSTISVSTNSISKTGEKVNINDNKNDLLTKDTITLYGVSLTGI